MFGRDNQKAALEDLADPSEVKGRMEVADRWYEVAAREDSLAGFRNRARGWYAEALPDTTGLERLKAERRMQEVREPLPETVKAPAKPAPRDKDAARPEASGQLRELLRIGGLLRSGATALLYSA